MFEGCLPADPLIRTEPLLGLQRLYLGQLFPALFTAAREDFPSSGGPRAGKKAVLVTTFSLGRLVCSFHPVKSPIRFAFFGKNALEAYRPQKSLYPIGLEI